MKTKKYFWEDFGHPCLKFPKRIGVALSQTKQNWEVEKTPVMFVTTDRKALRSNDHFVIYRTDTKKILEIVGPNVEVIQNEEAFEILSPYLKDNYIEGGFQVNNTVNMIVPLVNQPLSHRITPILIASYGHHAGASLKLQVFYKDEVSKVILYPFHTRGGDWTTLRDTAKTSIAESVEKSWIGEETLPYFIKIEEEWFQEFSNFVINEETFDTVLSDTVEKIKTTDVMADNVFTGIEEQWLYSRTIPDEIRESAIGFILATAEYHQHVREFTNKKNRYAWNTRLGGARHLRYVMKYLTEKIERKIEDETKNALS